MRYINKYCLCGDKDFLERGILREENILLLNKRLIDKEILKIEKKCPIKVAEINGKKENILIPNKEIETMRDTSILSLYIPEDVIIPIGGVDGNFYLRSLGKYLKNGLTELSGFLLYKDGEFIDELYSSFNFNYYSIGKTYAYLGKYFITKNIVFPSIKGIGFYPKDDTGYLLIEEEYEKAVGTDFIYYIYDNNGMCISIKHTLNESLAITNQASKLTQINLPNNTKVFTSMIIDALKDIKELQKCTSNTILGIVNYIESKGLELAIDLDSLTVHDINYKKYFERQNEEKRLKYKLK